MQMLKNWNPEQIPEKEDIKVRLSAARTRLYELQMALKEHKIPVIVLFEGWGASGKGSTISKVIKNIDPRFFKAPRPDRRARSPHSRAARRVSWLCPAPHPCRTPSVGHGFFWRNFERQLSWCRCTYVGLVKGHYKNKRSPGPALSV